MDNLVFLHFEALLTADKISYPDLSKFMHNSDNTPDQIFNQELRDYLLPIVHNITLHGQICSVLLKYNNNFLRTTHSENIAFRQLVEASKKLFPEIDSLLLTSSLISTFFIHALNINSKSNTIEDATI